MHFDRRKFLYYTSLSGLAMMTGRCASGSTQEATTEVTDTIPTTSKQKLGIALVGLGSYSTNQLAPALQLTEHCELKGIVTGSPEKIPIWQEKYGIPDSNVYNYDNLHTIADNPEIDIVYVVVPTGLHAKYSIIAAEAGKHVFCEKPMAMNVPECQSIIDACNTNKVRLAIAYRMQHEPNTQTVIQYAETKPYGALQTVQALAGYKGGGGSGWRFQKELGGGALYDMGVYTVNAIRYSTGLEPESVIYAKQSTKRPEIFTEVDETTEYQLRFSNGVFGYGKTSVGESFNQLRVDAVKGWYELSPMQQYNGVKGRTVDGYLLNKPIENQQAKQMDDDALAIKNNMPMIAPGEDGLKDVRIINAIQKSAARAEEVKI
ncbi:MAG: Gfo/Idh/MocA family oxidoreductase [Bacteroidota bacterium]